MEPQARRQTRSRKSPTPTTGTVIPTFRDARGFCEPLARYGELPTNILVAFYNHFNGLPAKSQYANHRLKELIHESAGLPASRTVLMRPAYQWRHGINHQTLYRKTAGTARLLFHFRLYDERMIRWATASQVVRAAGDQPSSDHDAALSIAMASLEIGARRSNGVKFHTQLDLLRNASAEAQAAANPLSIPVPPFTHVLRSGGTAKLDGGHVHPDSLFGLAYAGRGFIAYAVELDRSTEDLEPTANLQRQSWLRKILCYSAASHASDARPAPYAARLGLPNLLVLCLFQDARRMQHVMGLVRRYARYPGQFLFQAAPPIDPLLNASLLPGLFDEPWQRVNGPFSIREGR